MNDMDAANTVTDTVVHSVFSILCLLAAVIAVRKSQKKIRTVAYGALAFGLTFGVIFLLIVQLGVEGPRFKIPLNL